VSVTPYLRVSELRNGLTGWITSEPPGSGGNGGNGSTACPGVGLTAQVRAGAFHAVDPLPPFPPLPGGSDVIQPVNPFRNSDTRKYGVTLTPGRAYEFVLDARVPSNVVATAMNVVSVGASQVGWVKVWPYGQPEPEATTVNFDGGAADSGAVVVGTPNRRFMVKANRATHLIVDVTAYWTP